MSNNGKVQFGFDDQMSEEEKLANLESDAEFHYSIGDDEAVMDSMNQAGRATRGQHLYAEQASQGLYDGGGIPPVNEGYVDEVNEIEVLTAKLQAAEDARLRALAESDNVRRRMAKEKEEFVKYSASSVLGDILPSLDNLELALEHAPSDDASKNFVIGVSMTKKLLLDALKKHGLEPVGVIGEPFDPALHEAVGMEEDPAVENAAVSKLLTTGYKLHERLLRPARVIVCKK